MWHLERKELVNEFGEFSPTARYLFTESGNDGSPLQYGALSLRSCRGSETLILGRSNPHTGENADPVSREWQPRQGKMPVSEREKANAPNRNLTASAVNISSILKPILPYTAEDKPCRQPS